MARGIGLVDGPPTRARYGTSRSTGIHAGSPNQAHRAAKARELGANTDEDWENRAKGIPIRPPSTRGGIALVPVWHGQRNGLPRSGAVSRTREREGGATAATRRQISNGQ